MTEQDTDRLAVERAADDAEDRRLDALIDWADRYREEG